MYIHLRCSMRIFLCSILVVNESVYLYFAMLAAHKLKTEKNRQQLCKQDVNSDQHGIKRIEAALFIKLNFCSCHFS